MADAAGIAAITGGTSALIALIGHLNTRRQTQVSIEAAQQHATIEKDKLEHERQKSLAERRARNREARLEHYTQYLALIDDLARFVDGVIPLTPEIWREWRARESTVSTHVELLAGPGVHETSARLFGLVYEAKQGIIQHAEGYDLDSGGAVVRSTAFSDARYRMADAMREEVAAELDDPLALRAPAA